MRCLSCYYDLSHLTVNRCPECGQVFDPSDSSTFDTRRTPLPYRAWHLILLTLLAFMAGWFIVPIFHGQYSISESVAVGLLLLPLCFSMYGTVIFFRRRLRRRQN
jgi:hypothetical protein